MWGRRETVRVRGEARGMARRERNREREGSNETSICNKIKKIDTERPVS
jgi:hypothetical protein